jgi:type II secretory pathway pseudopilin PulG
MVSRLLSKFRRSFGEFGGTPEVNHVTLRNHHAMSEMFLTSSGVVRTPAARESGFTLAEVVISTAIILLTLGGVIYGYVKTTARAEWSAYSLAAQSLAMQGIEQTRAAKWDPQAWPPIDELGATNFIQVEQLDVPKKGPPVLATNFVSVTLVSLDPPLKELRADCVWVLRSGPGQRIGPFTNTVITLRAADQ